MAFLYKKTYIVKDPETGEKVKRKGRKWRIRFRGPDGILHDEAGFENKEATKRLASKLKDRAECLASGDSVDLKEQLQRPLLAHLGEYVQHLQDSFKSPDHIALTETYIRAILRGCRLRYPRDLDRLKVESWLARARRDGVPKADSEGSERVIAGIAKNYAEIAKAFGVTEATVAYWRKQGAPITPKKPNNLADILTWRRKRDKPKSISISTSKHYVRAIRAFGYWLADNSRIETNPFRKMKLGRVETDRRHQRRALTTDEAEALIQATASAPSFRRLSGRDRSVLYQIALSTGLRRGELASLTPENFNLFRTPRTVTIEAAYSKDRRTVDQPIPDGLADELRPW